MRLETVGRAALVLLAAGFVVRGATGAPAAWAFRSGRLAAALGHYPEAARLLPGAAFGAQRVEAKWLEGEVALGAWDVLGPRGRPSAAARGQLERASSCYLEGLRSAPALGWPVAGLAGVYLRREQAARAARVLDLADLDRAPWELLGDDARVGIGFLRLAIAREPTNFQFHDQLVLALEGSALHAEAVSAMRASAAVLPNFGAHEAFVFEDLPRDLVEAFYEESRSRVGEAPLQLLERQLLSLGQLGRRLGRLPEAEADLRRALTASGSAIFHAEDAFHLGLVLLDAGRGAEAETFFAQAGTFPVFAPEVASQRARIAELDGRLNDALEHLRRARALEPRNLRYSLEFARVAVRAKAWDQGREALRWAAVTDPSAPEPRRALVELSIAAGDFGAASVDLEAYARFVGPTPEVQRLRAELARRLDSPVP